MPQLHRSLFLLPLVAVAALIVAGCDSRVDTAAPPPAYEGQYKNSKGTVVLEIRDGKLIFTDPRSRSKVDIPFSDTGQKLMVESSSGNFTLTFQPPDTITGLPASIAGNNEPVKKAS